MLMVRVRALPLLIVVSCTAIAAPVTLEGRDINGYAVARNSPDAVFLYSADRDLTWLRDWDVSGRQTWYEKMSWASNLGSSIVGGFAGGWALPSFEQLRTLWRDVGCTTGSATRCYGLSDAGFVDLYEAPMAVWSSSATDDATSPLRRAFYFTLDFGYSFMDSKDLKWRATAVRQGDVLVAQENNVPEPGSLGLVLAALVGGIAVRRTIR